MAVDVWRHAGWIEMVERTLSKWFLWLAALAWFAADSSHPAMAKADGYVSSIREDVRSDGPGGDGPVAEPEPDQGSSKGHHDHDSEDSDYLPGSLAVVIGLGALYTISSPFWGPAALLEDDYGSEVHFADFPYHRLSDGSLTFSHLTCDCGALLDNSSESAEHAPYCAWHRRSAKSFSARLTGEWAEQPGDVSRIGGRLQLHTSSRFGLDTQMDWLREPASGPLGDELWLGDCNVIFRFAQSERAQFYTGVGLNWLDDPVNTDLGFNFTYGADFFPVKPWVVSSSIDWGSLGRAEQFRFRLTGGVMINRVEVFAGYEYLDIDRTQLNTYVGGVAVWF